MKRCIPGFHRQQKTFYHEGIIDNNGSQKKTGFNSYGDWFWNDKQFAYIFQCLVFSCPLLITSAEHNEDK